MASPPKLKVFRTAIGFHDAYVAAPSQKAALEAWGSDSNLFAQKAAELVTDAALIAEPLAQPGKVIKRLRGTMAEQIAALGPDKPRSRKPKAVEPDPDDLPTPRRKKAVGKTPAPKSAAVSKPKPKTKPKPLPRPDHSAVVAAEAAIAEASGRQLSEQKDLRDRLARLERERKDMERNHRRETEILEETRIRAEAAFDKAMKRWRSNNS